MEPFVMLVTSILTGALARVGELVSDGSLEKLINLIEAKSPDTLKKLQSANQNPALLPETIEVMATLLEDPEIQKVAEQVVKENQSNPDVINMMKNVGIVNQGTIHNPTFNFN